MLLMEQTEKEMDEKQEEVDRERLRLREQEEYLKQQVKEREMHEQ